MKMLLIALTFLAPLPIWAGHDYIVTASYYGADYFSVLPRAVPVLRPGDRVIFRTDDPGLLILQLDNGTYRSSSSGEIIYTVPEMARTTKILCSMLTSDGVMLGTLGGTLSGWGPPPGDPITYEGPKSFIGWLKSLLGL